MIWEPFLNWEPFWNGSHFGSGIIFGIWRNLVFGSCFGISGNVTLNTWKLVLDFTCSLLLTQFLSGNDNAAGWLRGGGGVWTPLSLADIICEQPLGLCVDCSLFVCLTWSVLGSSCRRLLAAFGFVDWAGCCRGWAGRLGLGGWQCWRCWSVMGSLGPRRPNSAQSVGAAVERAVELGSCGARFRFSYFLWRRKTGVICAATCDRYDIWSRRPCHM